MFASLVSEAGLKLEDVQKDVLGDKVIGLAEEGNSPKSPKKKDKKKKKKHHTSNDEPE
jgi:hypothetical protein